MEFFFHSEEVPTERCDGNQFLNNEYEHMMKSLKKMRLGRKRAKIKMLASPLCPIKRTHWNDGSGKRDES